MSKKIISTLLLVYVITVSSFVIYQQMQISELKKKVEETRAKYTDLERVYKTELGNSLSRASSVQATQDVLKQYYPSLKDAFNKHHYNAYLVHCEEITEQMKKDGVDFQCI